MCYITSRSSLELRDITMLPDRVGASVLGENGVDTCIPDGARHGSSGEAACIVDEKVVREDVVWEQDPKLGYEG